MIASRHNNQYKSLTNNIVLSNMTYLSIAIILYSRNIYNSVHLWKQKEVKKSIFDNYCSEALLQKRHRYKCAIFYEKSHRKRH